MDKCREDFQKAFPIPAHWIEFDEKTNRYYCPYVADATASTYQSKWVVWQHQQAKMEELQVQLKGAQERAQLVLQYKDKYRLERDDLQKRVDAALKLISEKSGDIYLNECVILGRFIDAGQLEQALKGEG